MKIIGIVGTVKQIKPLEEDSFQDLLKRQKIINDAHNKIIDLSRHEWTESK